MWTDLNGSAGLKELHIQTNGLDVSTIFDINNLQVDKKVLTDTQELIDQKLYGDLLRGFWIKQINGNG